MKDGWLAPGLGREGKTEAVRTCREGGGFGGGIDMTEK